jgi:hypothetical protein
MKEKPIITQKNAKKGSQGKQAPDKPLFESPPAGVIEVKEEVSAQVRAVKNSGEEGMSQFCARSFVSPEAARIGSQALLTAFDDSGLWLSSMAQPAHLVAELRQDCCLLTRVVITQWTRQGETQKLARLAEALVEAKPPVSSHEAGQILALLASLLGVLRPGPAPKWLAASRPLLRDSVDPHLVKEAAQWVAIGQVLASLPQEDRLFWNRRLRDPDVDWEWDSAEALSALRHVAPLLKDEKDHILTFQAVIPRCWWELWLESSLPVAQPTKARNGSGFILGLLSGTLMTLLGFWGYAEWKVSSSTDSVRSVFPIFSFHAVEGSEKSGAAQKAQSSKPLSAAMQARADEVQRIQNELPELEKLRNLVNDGNLSQVPLYIQGRSGLVTHGGRLHRALLSILMLAPPESAEIRQQVNKAAVRTLDSKEMYRILQLCLHEDSPNLKEAKECAELLLALSGDALTQQERGELTAAAK